MTVTQRVAEAVGRLVRLLARRPGASLLLVLAVGGLAGAWGMGLPIRSDMEDLFPEHSENVQRARQAREILGSRSELQVLFGSPSRELNRQVAEELGRRLAARTDLIGSVEYQRDTAFFEKNALLFVPVPDLEEMRGEVDEAIKEAIRKELSVDDFDLDEDEDAGGAEGGDAGGAQGGDAGGAKAGEGNGSRIPSEAEIREKYHAGDLSPYFESPDGQVIAVKAYPLAKPSDTDRTRALMEAVESDLAAVLAAHPGQGLEAAVEGDYTQITAAVDQISRDLTKASLLAFGLITLILTAWFRRLRAIFLILVPLLVGIALTLAFARLSIGYLNLITAFIFSILLGLGIDFAVHAASRTDEEVAAGHPLEEALPRALSSLGAAMLAAATTTMSTFLALTVFEFRGFSQFGLIAAAGVALCLGAVYLVLPPLMVAMDRVRRRPPAPVRHVPDHVRPGPWGRRAAVAVVVVAAGLTAASAAVVPRLHFDGDMSKMKTRAAESTSELRRKYRQEAEGRAPSPALVITDDLEETRAVHRDLERLESSLPRLDDVVSIWTFVPDQQEEKLAIVRDVKRMIDMKYGILEGQARSDADRLRPYLEPAAFGVADLPDWVKARFTDSKGNLGRYVLLYTNGRKSDAETVLEIQREIGTVHVAGRTLHSTATYYITADAYVTVRKEGPLAVLLATLVTLLLVTADFRNLRETLLAFVPLISGFVMFLGALVLLDQPLNLFNVVVLPTIVGIGVDTSIHLVHRLREERGHLVRVLRTTGAAAGISSATTAAGFLGLTVVANEGLRSIGWVAVIGIVVIFTASVGLTLALAALGLAPPPGEAPEGPGGAR